MKLRIREMAVFAMLGTLMYVSKIIMEMLPNIHLIGILTVVYTIVYRKKALYPIYLYVLLEILLYGIGTWNMNYLYVWGILALVAWLLREMESPLGWALVSGVFGLAFGALCAPVDFLMGDLGYVISKWISGIPFDVAHCLGNFAMALVLFAPLRKLLGKLYQTLLH